MPKRILIINGSPKKDGNTAALIEWFAEAAGSLADIEVIRAAALKHKAPGCLSCRTCQQSAEYRCAIDDDARPVLEKMVHAETILFATPLYFFAASAQTKILVDRMFSLYKWDNAANTFESPLKGKTLAVMVSAYEDVGLDAIEKPFALTARYTGMRFASLLIANAGISGQIRAHPTARSQTHSFARALLTS